MIEKIWEQINYINGKITELMEELQGDMPSVVRLAKHTNLKTYYDIVGRLYMIVL